MSNCEPCQNSEPVPCVTYDPPENPIPCVDGEPCPDIVDSGCVNYEGANLDNIGVKTNDRLNVILKSINDNHSTYVDFSSMVSSINESSDSTTDFNKESESLTATKFYM